MKKTSKTFLWAFTLISAIEIFAEMTENQTLIYIFKPLLMPALLGFLLSELSEIKHPSKTAFAIGLIFSMLGDTFLMFKNDFFLYGLGAFLIAQITYALGFFQKAGLFSGYFRKHPIWLLPFLVYLFGMLFFLYPGHSGGIWIPVVIYASAITLMAISAFNLKEKIPQKSWQYLIFGALFFIISDSLIALRVFGHEVQMDRLLVMTTYILGQYLLVRGVVFEVKEE